MKAEDIPVSEQLEHLDEIVRLLAELRDKCVAFDRMDALLDGRPGPESEPEIKSLLRRIERNHLRPMWGCIEGHSEWTKDEIEDAIWSCDEDRIDEIIHEIEMVHDNVKRGTVESKGDAVDNVANTATDGKNGPGDTAQGSAVGGKLNTPEPPKQTEGGNVETWLTVSEAATDAGVTTGTISRAATNGDLKCNGKSGRERRVPVSGLVDWLRRRNMPEEDKVDAIQEVIAKAAMKRQKK